MFALVGNSPSTGSTLLADLLDSSNLTACGPELEFFCNKRLYDFHNFQRAPEKASHVMTLRATGIFPRYDRLPAYGLRKSEFFGMISDAESLRDFFDRFTKHFLRYRMKDPEGVVFEKTPQNINCIGEYLNNYPEGLFVTITRNPIFVYNSLLHRGWGNFTALCTWFISSAIMISHLPEDRIFSIRYESLVNNSFTETASLLSSITDEFIEPSKVEDFYRKNQYRKKYSSQLESWGAYGKHEIVNANRKQISDSVLREFTKVFGLKISKAYAKHYGIPELTFDQVLRAMDYYDEVMEMLKGLPVEHGYPKRDWYDYRKLSAKWIREMGLGYAGLSDYRTFFRVVEPVE